MADHGKRGDIPPVADHVERRGQAPLRRLFYLGLCRLRGIPSPPAPTTVILQAGRSSVQQRCCSRQAVLLCCNVIRIGRGRPLPPWTLQAEPFFFAATNNRIGRGTRGAAGTGATPAAFYLGLCRLRGTSPRLRPLCPLQAKPFPGKTLQ